VVDDVGKRGVERTAATLGDDAAESLLDVQGRQVDDALGLRQTANEQFADLMKLENAAINRMVKDPDQAVNVIGRLYRKGGSPDNLKRFKEKIGAVPRGDLPPSPEGQQLWRDIQSSVLSTIRRDSFDFKASRIGAAEPPLEGGKMRQALDKAGGEDLLNETFGTQVTDALYRFADFVKEASPTKRAFKPISRGAEQPEQVSTFLVSVARRTGQELFDLLASFFANKAPGATQDFLTRGLGTGPGPTGVMRALGQGLSNVGLRGASQALTGQPQ
jgi:hypothetical protein